jgi:endonuclease III
MGKITPVDPQRIFEEISKLFPDAKCELNYGTDLQLLISIMLSAQTTDISVNRVTPELFRRFPTLEAFIEADITEIETLIKHLGLFRSKAKNIKAAVNKINETYGGLIPCTQDELESLSGVGRKTANVYLSEWHKIPRIAVDTHVKRVSVRLGLAADTDSPEKVELKLMKQFSEEKWIELHHKLIFFGRYFCKAAKPDCKICPLLSVCKKPLI